MSGRTPQIVVAHLAVEHGHCNLPIRRRQEVVPGPVTQQDHSGGGLRLQQRVKQVEARPPGQGGAADQQRIDGRLDKKRFGKQLQHVGLAVDLGDVVAIRNQRSCQPSKPVG
jgi:hypothetical protein